ncbi:Pentatricopeptide repeat-containing protein [Zostera marina]|uniref:Pentatricopeptide repeat-containing protein n=1 Tax=Zostera marina TaxID=29655 RepID=A0A0K9NXQ4_ZOSMR|nr:Pentatricopeptide repeat-containing protein [Zostera marina]
MSIFFSKTSWSKWSKSNSGGNHLSFLRHARLLFTSSPIVSVYDDVKTLVKSRNLSEIETLLESRKKNLKATDEAHFSSIIISYGYCKMLKHASRTFDQMSVRRTCISLNALLHSYNHSGKHARVPAVFNEVCRKYSIKPDATSYGILIKSVCQSGKHENAWQVLREMEEKGVCASAITYTPILDALYRNKNKEEADELWKEMIGKGCVPDLAAYNVRAMYHAHNGKPENVLKVFDEMESQRLWPDVISYNLLITCYCKCGRHLDAKNVYKSMWEKSVIPNAATYRNFMYLLCKNGDFDGGYNVCRDGIRKDKIPDIGPVKLLLQGLLKNSREKDARWLIRQLKAKFSPGLLKEWEEVEEKIGLSLD